MFSRRGDESRVRFARLRVDVDVVTHGQAALAPVFRLVTYRMEVEAEFEVRREEIRECVGLY